MMDSSHHQTTIHTLAGPTRGGGGNQTNKQHPMQHQFQHTQQPLVNTTSQNHQLLQFHHSPNQQQQLHPYSTLSTMQHHTGNGNNHLSLLNQLQHLNGAGGPVSQSNGFSNLFANQTLHRPTSSQNSASSQATTLGNFHLNNHHLQQQQQLHFGNSPSLQHQLLLNQTSSQNSSSSSGAGGALNHNQQQQAAYNVNSSDYSSSTYHVYDQILGDQIIDDLIVIKQERMKKKLEQEQRRKVILFSLAVILLVGLLMFLIVQLLRATNSNGGQQATFTPVTTSPISLPRIETSNDNSNQNQNNFPSQRTQWGAPPGGVDTNQWQFVPPGRFGPRQPPPLLSPHHHPTDLKPSFTPHQSPFVPQLVRPQPVAPVVVTSTTQQPIVVLPSVSQQQQPSLSLPQSPPSSSQTTQPPSSSSPSSQMRLTPTTSDNNNLRCHGKHCNPTSGCPNQCSGRGVCVKSIASSQSDNQWHQATIQQQEWRCQCAAGTTGDDCGILIERQCDDGLDNDKDGLVDCADSECCADAVCQNSTYCVKSPDPLDILMRKSPLPPTSSFFQRMHFLVEKSSSQIYSKLQDFSDSPWASPRNVDRASVIRGRVTYQRQGVTGVRVSIVGQTNLGITLSRDGGYFDLMVNGGGVILVEFKREPFATFQKAVRVPWNEIVLIDSIELQLANNNNNNNQDIKTESTLSKQSQALLSGAEAPTCLAHNYQVMRPQVTAISRTSKPSASSTLNSASRYHNNNNHQSASGKLRAVILHEFGLVQQSILLPQSTSGSQTNDSVSIVYVSSKAREYMSTINIQLTPIQVNGGESKRQIDELKQVHLKIVLEGVLFEQSFEPQWNLSFTYAWNRQNVYKQKSFGLSTASVSVGYEYSDCKHFIWSTRQVRLMGHDLPISEIGAQWNLNIHHRYNYRDSILQRGDGQDYLLKTDRLPVVVPVMGDGYPRQQNCPFCDGATSPSEQKLLRPQALVSAPDGSIYVGDHNMIRRIEPPSSSSSASASAPMISLTGSGGVSSGGQVSSSSASVAASERAVRTVLEMNNGRVPDEYSLALNLAPVEAPQLHLVDTSHNQILSIREQRSASTSDSSNETTPPSSTLEDTLVPVVGTGDKCQPDDRQSCGDGQAAKLARLIEPRAAVFDLAGRMYIADGPNVRLVDLDQRIYTILGDYSPHNQRQHHQTKFPCNGEAIAMHKFSPRAPRDLAINPVDETLHLLDENVVYKITQDKRVQVVAGRPAHCATPALVFGTSGQQQQQQRASQVSLQAASSIAFNQMGQLFIGEDDQLQTTGRVLLVTPEDDSISLYAGQPSQEPQVSYQHELGATQHLLGSTKQRSSNALPPMGAQATRAPEHKFSSVAALAVDQLGNLLVADKIQLRLLSIEPDLPQLNSMGEYEIQSPDEPNELLVFNRHGLQVATRELSTGSGHLAPNGLLSAANVNSQHQRTKYTFAYNVNTSYGLLASVSYANGNKVSIYRDAPHHNVKLIETAFGGQCKLDVSRQGQVHSIATLAAGSSASASSKISMTYHGEAGGGLLKQTRDQMTGEQFDFSYDEFGRATAIQQQQTGY